MHVTSMTVRFARTVRPADYESVTADVSLTASMNDDGSEDHKAMSDTLMLDARNTVLHAGIRGQATEATADAATAEAPKANKGGRPKKQTLTPPADTSTPAPADPIEASPAPADPDEFDEFESAPTTDEKPMSAKELQDWITSHLQAKKIEVTTVKAVLATYGAAATRDTKEEDRAKIKKDIEAKLKA